MKKISIVISVYNEEKVLELFFNRFKEMCQTWKWDYELICVNDGSFDDSLLILKKYAAVDKKIKVISFSRNYGHEAAMIAGIDNAEGEGIVCMDADLQHPLECIEKIISKFEEGYEVISMVRLENKSAGFVKNLTSKAFYKVINVLSDQAEFEENASDFFAITQNVAYVLRNNYREKVRFLRGYVQSVGFKKTTIQYKAAARAGGESHYSIKKLMKFSIGTIVCFSDFPLKVGIYIGFGSIVFGIVVLLYSLVNRSGAPSGYTTLVTLICLLFGMVFFILGIMGQYIAVLFTELKDRPIYLVDEKINFMEE